jgi:hypothetical protein
MNKKELDMKYDILCRIVNNSDREKLLFAVGFYYRNIDIGDRSNLFDNSGDYSSMKLKQLQVLAKTLGGECINRDLIEKIRGGPADNTSRFLEWLL